jgi:hypothetical protein
MISLRAWLQKNKWYILGSIVVIGALGLIETGMGRSFFGPDGRFGWWDGNIWGSENSQRVADAYSFSHVIHGMLFYAFLWLVARRMPLKYRFVIALLMKAAWELLENSPFVINRYRAATISQGYVGDSVLNSMSDVMMVGIGFAFAYRAKLWAAILAIVAMEVGCLIWVRDNLTLNVIMLTHPIESIRLWQGEKTPR